MRLWGFFIPTEDFMHESKSELVQEFFDSRGQAIASDRDAGVLRGVKLLGLRSRNGRLYQEKALRDAVALYEGAKVNVNHPPGDPLGARDYRDRLGVIRNVQVKQSEGLYGDLHFNPKLALAEPLSWDAEHAPENVGLSHNVLARTRRDGKNVVVEAISKVQSVDLVADPATTAGFYEHESSSVALSVEEDEANKETNEQTALRRKAAIGELAIRHALTLSESETEQTQGESFLEELLATKDGSEIERLIATRAERVREAAIHTSRSSAPESQEQTWLNSEGGDAARCDKAAFVEAIKRQ